MSVEDNKKLVEKYPFLRIDCEERYNMLDDMPDGWRKAFGDKFCEEVYNAAVKDNLLNKLRIIQIKEKFGALRVYSITYTDDLLDIFNKYEKLSATICIECGKPATKITLGWISPYCDNCIPKNSNGKEVDNKTVSEFYKMLGHSDC